MIPIARETYLNTIKENVKGLAYIEDKNGDIFIREDLVLKAMIEFAKLHVHEALKKASKKAAMKSEDEEDLNDYHQVIDKDSILNAYPDELIK